MIRQHSFENDKPTLYLVPTPIGNLNEMSPRAIEILKSVDVIACEDTRTSGQLLKHFDIHSHLIAYHNFNEEASSFSASSSNVRRGCSGLGSIRFSSISDMADAPPV